MAADNLPIHYIVLSLEYSNRRTQTHEVTKLKHFPRHWPFVMGVYRSSEITYVLLKCIWTRGLKGNGDHRVMYQ